MALSGKTVLVFGGSSGMGKAAAKTVLKLYALTKSIPHKSSHLTMSPWLLSVVASLG
jgi:NADPH:quinone reductase-like Zn-dependent oxidoreductase